MTALLLVASFALLSLLHCYWLAGIAVAVALRAGLFGAAIDHWALRWMLYALAAMMFARAVGDFRFVGFFKSVRGTPFARADKLVYSPLCLAFGAGLTEVAGV